MRVYSPSQTTAFIENPLYRELCYIDGWHPIQMGFPDRALVAGGGFNEGVLTYYEELLKEPGRAAPIGCDGVAESYVKDRLVHLERQRFVWKEEAETATLAREVGVAVSRYIAADPLPRAWLVAVEPTYTEHGNAKPDLVLRLPHLTPLDFKFKLTLDEDRLAQTLIEYAYSWQMLHYAWGTSLYYGEPVQNYGIIVVRSRPFKVWTHFVPLDPELMEIWKTSARSAWAIMGAIDGRPEDLLQLIAEYPQGIPPWATFKWYGRYGRDAMAAAILDHKLDEGLMTLSYIKQEGR